MSTKYSVCILSAGRGFRLGKLTEGINKSLLPINGKAVISHIIEKFSRDVKIVVAIGYQADKVREYLLHSHDDRDITFVEVDNWSGQGAGPGYSLLCCKNSLPGKFIIYAADTILDEPIPPPSKDWLGVAPVKSTKDFCTISLSETGNISKLYDKVECDNKFAFVGVAGISDYNFFWKNLKNDERLINNELQLSNGLAGLIPGGLYPEKFTWYDTGTTENFEKTKASLENDKEKFNFDKINEFTYQINGRLVKYFADSDIVKKRVNRAKSLKGLVPEIRKSSTWFYSYELIKGTTLYECLTTKITSDFLEWASDYLWTEQKSEKSIVDNCKLFYKEKTDKRLSMIYEKYPDLENSSIKVNGRIMQDFGFLYKEVQNSDLWNELINEPISVKFHGDLQFDNVLKTGWLDYGKDAFKLIDWRQDFGSLIECGDLYYDLGKLLGGLTIPYNLIKQNRFTYRENDSEVYYDIDTTYALNESQKILYKFIDENDLNRKKVDLVRALIFLNMSPLHEYPFDKLLYYVGWNYLQEVIEC